jgi:hypothetical protein
LREAKAELEEEERQKAGQKQKEWDESAPADRPHTKRPDPETAAPAGTAQYNPVDPDSRVQYSCRSGYLQGYNAQAGVDADTQVIVACDLTNGATDVRFLTPMLDEAIENTGAVPEHVLADGGYYSGKNVSDADARGVTALIPPPLRKSERIPLSEVPPGKGDALSPKLRMRHLLSRPQMQERYAKRGKSVETVFAQIKGSPGHSRYTRFLRRGLEKCRQDWMLVCSMHNFSKYRVWKMALQAA